LPEIGWMLMLLEQVQSYRYFVDWLQGFIWLSNSLPADLQVRIVPSIVLQFAGCSLSIVLVRCVVVVF
jgi:hypothetical protein